MELFVLNLAMIHLPLLADVTATAENAANSASAAGELNESDDAWYTPPSMINCVAGRRAARRATLIE